MSRPHICNKKHSRPPGYVRAGTEHRPALVFQGYKARPLLNCTVGSFWEVPDNELAQKQIEAKREFQQLFADVSKLTWHWLHEQDLAFILAAFARCFDEFFFFGSLFHTPYIHVSVRMLRNRGEGDEILGFATPSDPNDPREWTVSIARKAKDGRGNLVKLELADLLATLYHELCHVYLGSFLCNSERCVWYKLNAAGVSGHGPVFRALEHCGTKTLETWGVRFDTWYSCSDFVNCVWQPSWEQECTEVRRWKEGDDKLAHSELANLRRKPSPNEIIQVQGTSVVIDAPRLRRHVKQNAKRYRKY